MLSVLRLHRAMTGSTMDGGSAPSSAAEAMLSAVLMTTGAQRVSQDRTGARSAHNEDMEPSQRQTRPSGKSGTSQSRKQTRKANVKHEAEAFPSGLRARSRSQTDDSSKQPLFDPVESDSSDSSDNRDVDDEDDSDRGRDVGVWKRLGNKEGLASPKKHTVQQCNGGNDSGLSARRGWMLRSLTLKHTDTHGSDASKTTVDAATAEPLPPRRVSFIEPGQPTSRRVYPGEEAAMDRMIWWTLLVVAYGVRFYRLGVPASVVFDEFHFGKFVDNTIKREIMFDIHPPLGKLTLAGLGYLAGYRPVEGFGYDSIGKDYGAVLYYPLREVSAVFGTLTVPIVYSTARLLDVSWVGALVAAGLYCFDSLNVIESRLILMDSQIMFYLVLSLNCSLRLWRTPRDSRSRFIWLTLTGLVCGLSFSVKWTALATPALVALVSFFGLHFLRYPLSIGECAWAGFVGVSLYVWFFYVFFTVHTRDGPGAAFFRDEFKRTLVGHTSYDPTASRESFWRLFVYLNRTMLATNAAIKTRHQWESYWYWWVVNWRGVLYFNREVSAGQWAAVYLIGNPMVCWLCGACVFGVLMFALYVARNRDGVTCMRGRSGRPRRQALQTCMFLVCGWLMNLLPYILVDRSAFVYHYLPGLLYAQLLAGVMIDQLPRRASLVTAAVVLCATVATYAFFSPWVYCIPLTKDGHAARRWFGRWD